MGSLVYVFDAGLTDAQRRFNCSGSKPYDIPGGGTSHFTTNGIAGLCEDAMALALLARPLP